MIPPAPSEARPTAIGRVLVLCGLVAATTARAEDWPRFRGPDGTGVAENTGIPDTWTDADYAWVVDLPGEGHGSPVVADARLSIAYTSSTGRAKGSGLVVLDVASGSEIWRRTIAFRPAGLHRQNGFASWSPAVGGGLNVVSVADPDGHSVTGIDLDVIAGETQPRAWSRDFPGQDSTHGFGSSPAVVTPAPGGTPLAIIPVDHLGPSRLVALDAKTGDVVWEAERPAGEKSAYATPLVLRDGAGVPTAVVASSSSAGVRAYDVRDGAELWSTPPMPARVVASPILAGDLVIQTCGGGGAGKALWAIDRDTGEIRHTLKKRLPYVPTPVAYDGHLFLCGDNGVCSCVDLESFETVWTERVGRGFDASPVVLDGRVFAVDNDGVVHVFAASPEFRKIAAVPLGGPSSATPAYADGRLFLRTTDRLFCLRGPDVD